jgi:type VI secretion system protein VasD
MLMAGCGQKPPAPPPPAPPPPPTRVVADLYAADDLNPNPLGRPSPVQLRVYELKTPGAFERADFFSLYEKDAAALGPDLVAREELAIRPGQFQRLERTLQADTRYLGLMAAYREVDRAHWRALIPTPPHQTTTIRIDLQRAALVPRPGGQ